MNGGRNAGNQGGNAGTQGGNAGTKGGNAENSSQNKNQHPQDLGLKFENTNIEKRISIFKILCVHVRVCQFSGKTDI